ncbi:MAG: FtsX-like permease family protein [Flammeovirgaceae bacterium]|nr:FtsX-like permease family protein [Flammeovirgaceae bacterium]
MFKNYLIIAVRNLLRHKMYSLVSLIGLAIGVSFVTLLIILIDYELRFDSFHRYAKRTYRIVQVMEKDNLGEKSASVPLPMASTLKRYYSDFVEHTVRLFNFQGQSHAISSITVTDNEKNFLFADEDFFNVFDFPLSQGNPDSVLKNPMSIVITEELAEKYFGTTDVVGQRLVYGSGIFFTITGTFAPLTRPTHIPIGLVASFSSLETIFNHYGMMKESWMWNPCWTYVVLKENASPEELEYKLKVLVERVFPEVINQHTSLHLQPLTEIHLYSHLDNELSQNGDISYVYIFIAMGLLIFVITTINFTNLSTARYSLRAKEVGIRKAIGAGQKELIEQFLFEAVFISLIASFLSLIFVETLLPLLSEALGKRLYLRSINVKFLGMCVFVTATAVGIIASLYPSYYLARFQPMAALNGALSRGVKSKLFRRILVVVQFVITIFLMISTLITFEQVYFMHHTDVGFNAKNVLIVPLSEMSSRALYPTLAERIRKIEGVTHVTCMEELLGVRSRVHFYRYEKDGELDVVFAPSLMVDYEFVETFDIPLLAGRTFQKNNNDEKEAVIINEEMVKYMGWGSPEKALGKKLESLRGREKVIGVIKNFSHQSLHKEVMPLVIDLASHTLENIIASKYLAIKTEENRQDSTLTALKTIWKEKIPYKPFEYFLLEKEIDTQYYEELRFSIISLYLALVAIVISMLGLFGISAFVVGQRRKEVAIRKALGITDWQVVWLLSKEFFGLVVVAMLIAFPISYVAMFIWLQDFAYRTAIHVKPFVISGAFCLLVTLLTTSYHTIKASVRPPIKDL